MAKAFKQARVRPVQEAILTDEPMRVLKVVHEPQSEAIARTRAALRKAAAGERLTPTKVLSFEDPAAFAALLTPKRYAVFLAVRQHKAFGSIQALSTHVRRNRAGVSRDVNVLVEAGLLQLLEMPFPGHGKRSEIRPAADALELRLVL